MRKKFASKIFKVFQIISLSAFCSIIVNAQSTKKASVLKACTNLFGSIIDAKENLFEINSLFVLQAKFDSHDELTELAVFPKYFLEESHPEWTEPNSSPRLTKVEYENLLLRLDEIKSKGMLMESATSGVITNSTQYFLDQYEYGFLHRGERGDDRVRFFSFHFYHLIEGKVKSKRKFNLSIIRQQPYYYVIVGECGYFVSKETFTKLKVDRVEKFFAAGPTRWEQFAGSIECES